MPARAKSFASTRVFCANASSPVEETENRIAPENPSGREPGLSSRAVASDSFDKCWANGHANRASGTSGPTPTSFPGQGVQVHRDGYNVLYGDGRTRWYADTEQRIALARGYFNDIATYYNTRLEIVPERFVARENGLRFELSFSEGYSVGLFLDQRPSRMSVGKLVAANPKKFARVLDCYAYAGGFSLQAARGGARVALYEMRPGRPTPAHQTGGLAELVCSNSLKSEQEFTAPWLLKEELRRLDSLLLRAAVRRGLRYTDTSTDIDSWRMALTFEMEARRSGACVLLGAGLAPGVTNVMARAAAARVAEPIASRLTSSSATLSDPRASRPC